MEDYLNLTLDQELEDLLLVDDNENNDDIDQLFESNFKASIIQPNKLSLQSLDKSVHDTELEDDLQQIFRSSQALQSFQSSVANYDDYVDENNYTTNDTTLARYFELPIEVCSQSDLVTGHISNNSGSSNVSIIFSEEDLLSIRELLELMVSSVERCAPINNLTDSSYQIDVNVAALQAEEEQNNDVDKLIIIEDDFELSHNANTDETLNDITNKYYNEVDSSDDVGQREDASMSLLQWNNHLKAEQQHEKEYQLSLIVQQDEFLWQENNAIKQIVEKQQSEIYERKKKRQLERDNAVRDTAAVSIQCMYRISKAKLIISRMYEIEHIRLAFVKAEMERLHQLELNEKEKLLAIEEMKLMESVEKQCRTVWLAIKVIELEKIELEMKMMKAEDQLAWNSRDYIRSLDVIKAQYMQLATQEDIEYDLIIDDSDEDDEDHPCNDSHKLNTQGISSITEISPAVCSVPIDVVKPLQVKTNKPVVRTSPPILMKSMKHKQQSWGGTILQTSLETTGTNNNTTSQVISQTDCNAKYDGFILNSCNIDTIIEDNSGVPQGICSAENISRGGATGLDIPVDVINNCTKQSSYHSSLSQDWLSLITSMTTTQQESIPTMSNSNIQEENKNQSEFMLDLIISNKSNNNSNSNVNFFQVPILQAGFEWMNDVTNRITNTTESKSIEAAMKGNVLSVLSTVSTSISVSEIENHTKSVQHELIIKENDDDDDDDDVQEISSIVDLETNPLLASELDLCVEGLTNIKFLRKFTNLNKLVVNVNKIIDLSGIQSLQSLVYLSAKDNRICSLNALKGMHHLKYLYLDTNKISNLSPLNALHNLCVLSVNSNIITEMPVLQCTSLQRLELYCNRITCVPEHSLLGVPNLIHLDLGSNQIRSINGDAISSCALLQTLILSQNQLSDIPVPLRLPLLKNLWLNGNKIPNLNLWKEKDEDFISSFRWPLFVPSLNKLFLRDNLITYVDPDVMSCFPLLVELDLSFNQLTSRRNLAGIQECKLLTALHVQDNPFTTVPVINNNGGTTVTVSTSRTALPIIEQVALNTWLLELCPSLDTISSNTIARKDYEPQLLLNCPQDLIHQYMKTKDWLSEHDHHRSDGHHWNNLKYLYSDARLRKFIHLLKMLQLNQTCFTSKEKQTKRDDSKAASNKKVMSDGKRINKLDNTQIDATITTEIDLHNKKEMIDWEKEYLTILQNQKTQIMDFLFENSSLILKDRNSHYSGVYLNYLIKKNASTITDCDVMKISIIHENSKKVSFIPDNIQVIGSDSSIHHSQANCSNKDIVINTSSNISTNVNNGVIRFQSLFRGQKVRNKFQAALKSIRYEDAELDDMLLFNPDEYNFEDFDYMESLNGVNTSGGATNNMSVTMVYGDHIRKRSRTHNEMVDSNKPQILHPANQQAWILPSSNVIKAYDNAEETFTRPTTSMTTVSTISACSDRPSDSRESNMESSPVHSSISHDRDDSIMLSSRSINTKQSKALSAAAAAQEWGISDPKVLAAMMKRNQRLKGFADAKEIREQDRDPTARLNRFLRNAHKSNAVHHSNHTQAAISNNAGNTSTSGSFGGKPKTMRAVAGKNNRKSMAVPAWMLGANDIGKDEES